MNILGINAYHGDSAAALIVDGKLVAAIEEERIRRIKHWAGFPSEAISECLVQAGITAGDLDIIAVNQDSNAHLWRKLAYVVTHRPNPALILERLRNRGKRAGAELEISAMFPKEDIGAKVVSVEHHLAHLSSAYHVSPFDEAVTISVDGFGDFASSAWGVARGTEITLEGQVFFPHSLGIFYEALTQYLGFPNYGDEYKVMGLAPYGQPQYLDKLRNIVMLQDDGTYRLNLDYFRHARETVQYEWENGVPVVGTLYSEQLVELLGPARKKDEPVKKFHYDIARSTQAMYEEAFFHLVNSLHARHGVENLALAGGCAMNSVANGKIRRMSPFKRVYIQSAAGDAGGAIGAALIAWYRGAGKDQPRFQMDHAYWGPEFDNFQIERAIAARSSDLDAQCCVVEFLVDEHELVTRTATAISEGKVTGWFQGRMEWGPRALGNRSIVCDPRRADMKDILNLKIKRRESFRPFAPSILREHVVDWFEEDDDVPFMMKVFQIKNDRRSLIPAVTHVDGSGRLQTVSRDSNRRYYELISAFGDLTGVPIVLNTSFNENEPIVCKPEEALDCFLRTKMDVLVLGDYFIVRKNETNSQASIGQM